MPPLQLVENPDILATISKLKDKRPPLVIGFAAETEHLIDNAKAKIKRKGCDWILANDVSPETGVMGGDRNTIHLLTRDGGDIAVDSWPVMTKEQVATELVARIAKEVGANRERQDQGRNPPIAAWRRPRTAGLSERGCGRPRSARRGAGRGAADPRARHARDGADRARDRAALGL